MQKASLDMETQANSSKLIHSTKCMLSINTIFTQYRNILQNIENLKKAHKK